MFAATTAPTAARIANTRVHTTIFTQRAWIDPTEPPAARRICDVNEGTPGHVVPEHELADAVVVHQEDAPFRHARAAP